MGGSFEGPPPQTAPGIPALKLLTTEDLGAKLIIHWKVFGDQSNVRAYQAEQKPQGESIWHPVSNYVPVNPGQQEALYRAEVDRAMLISTNQIPMRVRAIGPDGGTLAASDSVILNSPCKSMNP